MAFNTLRSPHCDDCPGCRTCVLWAEDFDLHGARPLAAGEVEPVSWTGFTLTPGSRVAPALPSYTPVEAQACEGFTVTGGFGSGWYPAKVLTTTGTGTVAITSPVTKGYRARVVFTVANPSTNIDVSLAAGLAELVAYKMPRTDTDNGIAKLYVAGELKALVTFPWPSTGGEWQLALDIYDHSRTGSMVYGYFAYGLNTRELFAACPCAGDAVTFAIDANPDAVTIDVTYVELLAHNSEAPNAASCPQPAEPCTSQACGRWAEDWQTMQVELPVGCDDTHYYGAGEAITAVAWGTSARDGNTRWYWIDEDPADNQLGYVDVQRNVSTAVGTVDLRVTVDYYGISEFDPYPPCDGVYDNWDPDTLPELAPDAPSCICERPLGTIVCQEYGVWDFDCAAVTWSAYGCEREYSTVPCKCAELTIYVTPQGC